MMRCEKRKRKEKRKEKKRKKKKEDGEGDGDGDGREGRIGSHITSSQAKHNKNEVKNGIQQPL
jgi:hypothetical protein